MSIFTSDQEAYIQHEVKIRLLQDKHKEFEKIFDRIEEKMDSHFHWTLGTIFALILTIIALFGTMALHMAKLA